MIEGKARLVKDDYCDGLGACLGECPVGAISIIEREAAGFDEGAVEQHLAGIGRAPLKAHAPAPAPHAHAGHGGCPGSMMRQFAARPATPESEGPAAASELRQWPVQLHLLSPTAPYLRDAELVLAADCAAFALGDFHARFLKGRALAIACPKLDDPSGYVEKLAMMITDGGVRAITIVRMQVPCCGGLERMVDMAFQVAGMQVPVRHVVVGIEGGILRDEG
jgi:ferredoxin